MINSASTAENTDPINKFAENTHIVSASVEKEFKADNSTIWNTLIDFKKYPVIFKRIKSVEITKTGDNLVYTESHLKPGVFIQEPVQHTVNDLSAAPKVLNWRMLDGNFKYLKGKWELQQKTANTCLVKYTLSVDAGALIPAALINFLLHHIQQEIVNDLKNYVESLYNNREPISGVNKKLTY